MKRRSVLAMGTLALVAIGVLGLAACGKKASQTEEEVKGLVIHYDMSMSDKRTLTDVSGNGNDGEVFVASGFSVEDGVGFLDGTAIGLPSEVFTGEDEISISIWTKDYSGATNTSLIYLGADTSSIESYYLLNPSNPSGRLKSVFTNSVNTAAPYNTEVGVSPTIASNGVQGPMVGLEWNHFVVVFSGTTMTTYMNGKKIADTELSKSLSDFGDIKAYLGRSAYTDDPLYVGFIQDVKIYNEACSMIKEERCQNAYIVFRQLSLYPLGQNGLGVCYAYGYFVEKDMEKAAYWFKNAAHKGLSLAQFNLGNCYYHGNGVAKDRKMAYYWYKRADEQGLSIAKEMFTLEGTGERMFKKIEDALNVERWNRISSFFILTP